MARAALVRFFMPRVLTSSSDRLQSFGYGRPLRLCLRLVDHGELLRGVRVSPETYSTMAVLSVSFMVALSQLTAVRLDR